MKPCKIQSIKLSDRPRTSLKKGQISEDVYKISERSKDREMGGKNNERQSLTSRTNRKGSLKILKENLKLISRFEKKLTDL